MIKPILSLNDLSSRLGVSRANLAALAFDVEEHYRSWQEKNERTGKVRTIHAPSTELKDIQKRITRKILLPIEICPEVHGGVKGCSPKSNATPHLQRRWLVTLDVRNFFPAIQHKIILQLFRRELGYGRDVARLLTRLTTLGGSLPPGAPTSLALANLILWKPVDVPTAAIAAAINVNYTRWVDDIALSGDDPRPIINAIAKRLSQRGLRLYRQKNHGGKSKLAITAASQRQEVTGLVVNGKTPSLSRQRRDAVRAAIHQATQLQGLAYKQAVASIQGRIIHVNQFNAGTARRLRDDFRSMQESR